MFICGHTMQLVSYGPKGDGYTVTDLKSFARKALPLLKLGFMLLQIGLLSTGIPIPLVGMAETDKLSYLRSAARLLDDQAIQDSLGSSLDSAQAKNQINSAVCNLGIRNDRENVRSAVEIVSTLLKSEDPHLPEVPRPHLLLG